jgi:hypothetical protein
MGGPDDVSQYARQGRWNLEGAFVLAAPDFQVAQPGASVEFTRRIPFGARTVELSQLTMDNHWSFDVGVGVQSFGWRNGRPGLLAGTGRVGFNYNLFNRIGVGLAARGGYANVAGAVEGQEANGGVLFGGGLRLSAIITSVTAFSEIGVLSLPSANGEGRDGTFYGLAGLGYMF